MKDYCTLTLRIANPRIETRVIVAFWLMMGAFTISLVLVNRSIVAKDRPIIVTALQPIIGPDEEVLTLSKLELEQLKGKYETSYYNAIEHYRSTITLLQWVIGMLTVFMGLMKFFDRRTIAEAQQEIKEKQQEVNDFIDKYDEQNKEQLQELRQGLQESELNLKFQIALSQNTSEEKKTQLLKLLQEAEEKGANPLFKAKVLFKIAYVTENLEENVKAYSITINFIEQALTPTMDEATRRELEDVLANSYTNKGYTLHCLRKFPEALLYYGKAIELNPKCAEAHNNKGLTLLGQDKFEEALSCFEKAIDLNPTHALFYSNKGSALSHLRRFPEALLYYEKAIELKPTDDGLYYNKGFALLRGLGKATEALACYDKAIELKPTYANAYFNKGVALNKLGNEAENTQEQKEYYQQALAVLEEMHLRCPSIGQETKEHEEKLKAQLEEALAKLQA